MEYIKMFKTSGIEVEVIKADRDWVLADLMSGKVLKASFPRAPKGVKSPGGVGRVGSGQIHPLPLPFLLALWLGWRKGYTLQFTHQTVSGEFPPGAEMTMELFPPEPLAHFIWSMTFGDLVDPNVVIIHKHRTMMMKHEDPLIYSIVAHTYPLNLFCTKEMPHEVTIRNNAVEVRYVEATFWIIEGTRASAEYIFELLEGYESMIRSFRVELLERWR